MSVWQHVLSHGALTSLETRHCKVSGTLAVSYCSRRREEFSLDLDGRASPSRRAERPSHLAHRSA
jgi:hypothetical protein